MYGYYTLNINKYLKAIILMDKMLKQATFGKKIEI